MTYTEWGVMLSTGVICPAASFTVAKYYGPEPGFPVVRRTVRATAVKKSGTATIEVSRWVLRGGYELDG